MTDLNRLYGYGAMTIAVLVGWVVTALLNQGVGYPYTKPYWMALFGVCSSLTMLEYAIQVLEADFTSLKKVIVND